jgi:hypothetical protein
MTLEGSLLARLDRLASARETAQIGAALGQRFSHELIAAVAAIPPQQLEDSLTRLEIAELLARHATCARRARDRDRGCRPPRREGPRNILTEIGRSRRWCLLPHPREPWPGGHALGARCSRRPAPPLGRSPSRPTTSRPCIVACLRRCARPPRFGDRRLLNVRIGIRTQPIVRL